MGERSKQFFDDAHRLGGWLATMRLASLGGLTSTEAAFAEDSPEILVRLEKAMKDLRSELEARETQTDHGHIEPRSGGGDDGVRLRRYFHTFLELMSQRRRFVDDVNAAIRRVNEAAATTLGVARVSVWFLDVERTKISCADLYELAERKHSAGVELFDRDFSTYFDALESERTIAAHDARVDPRTSCFTESYLTPLGITSMLDVPIWVRDKMVGVICHEHIGPARVWNSDEEMFAYLMSTFVALVIEQSDKGGHHSGEG